MHQINIFCPAKINLFLEVTSKLPSGYHELATLFAKLNFGDEINLKISPSQNKEIKLSLTGPLGQNLTADENNLVYKAAALFLNTFDINAALDITLTKNVPMGAGLGGGSSDAGCLLGALSKFFNIGKEKVLPIASKLGADVALFVYDEPMLKGEGIGDKLTPLRPAGKLPYVLLVYPLEHVSTKDVFKRVKLAPQSEILTSVSKLDKIIRYLKNGSELKVWQELMFNRLEEFVLPYTPKVSELKFFLQSHGSGGVMMSGSGSTVFALHDDYGTLENLVVKLKQQSCACYITQLWEGVYEHNGDPYSP